MRHSLTEIRTLLRRLDGEPADAIESETLECKPWDPDRGRLKDQLRDVREAVVCLANARGGTIVLGIQDRKRTRKEAITGVADLMPDAVRRAVYDGTDPHILADIEEITEPEGRLLVVQVPRGLGVHTTAEGVAKIRVGKECKPLTGSMLSRAILSAGATDLTAQTVPDATLADLDPAMIQLLQRAVEHQGRKPELARLGVQDFLENLGVIRDSEMTLAGVLLLGRAHALARWASQHEVVFIRFTGRIRHDLRHNLKGPILALLDAFRRLLEANLKIGGVETTGFGEITDPELTWWAAREALLNALVHRDYFLNQSVHVELREDRLEMSSPGGFIGGISPSNILRHAPVRRNPLLADVLELAGYVNRAGMGVDRIYEDLLRLGKAVPRYEADESTVRLILPTKTHKGFARFVAEESSQGRSLTLDDLILLRAVTDRGHVDRWSAAQGLQTSEDEASDHLVSLRERGYLVPHGRGRGTSYHLARFFSKMLRGQAATDEVVPLDDEAVKLRIQAILSERGRLTNADIRRISGYSRSEVLRLMRVLRDQGIVFVSGRGRGAHYLPGPGAAKRGGRAKVPPR